MRCCNGSCMVANPLVRNISRSNLKIIGTNFNNLSKNKNIKKEIEFYKETIKHFMEAFDVEGITQKDIIDNKLSYDELRELTKGLFYEYQDWHNKETGDKLDFKLVD